MDFFPYYCLNNLGYFFQIMSRMNGFDFEKVCCGEGWNHNFVCMTLTYNMCSLTYVTGDKCWIFFQQLFMWECVCFEYQINLVLNKYAEIIDN